MNDKVKEMLWNGVGDLILSLIFGSFPNDSITVMTENFLSYFLGLPVSFFAFAACFLSSSNNSLDLGNFFSSSRYWWNFFSLMYRFILRWSRDSSWISSFCSSLRISFYCSSSFSTWISSSFFSLRICFCHSSITPLGTSHFLSQQETLL